MRPVDPVEGRRRRRSRRCWRSCLPRPGPARAGRGSARGPPCAPPRGPRGARGRRLLRGAVQLDHFALERLAHELVKVVDAADVDPARRAGSRAPPRSEDQPALDDLDDAAFHRFAGIGGDPRCGATLSRRRGAASWKGSGGPSASSLVRTQGRRPPRRARPLSAGLTDLADRELVAGDDTLGLVADVDEDLVFCRCGRLCH